MRVLYVASRNPNARTLLVEHEVTKLQRQLRAKTGANVGFIFLPALQFQDLRNEVELYKPDVLHISAHGSPGEVHFVDSLGKTVSLNAGNVTAALGTQFRPHVIYLSACHSAPLAEQLSNEVPVTIGTTDDVENYYAREASMAFYESLYSGNTVQQAFDVSKSLLETLSREVSTRMFSKATEARRHILHHPPQLVARFSKLDDQGDKEFWFEPGFLGVPDNTNQAIFFTNDMTYAKSDKTLENDLCWISRDSDYGDIHWLDEYWKCKGDFRMFATAVTGSGEFRTVYAKVADALMAYYTIEAAKRGAQVSKRIQDLIATLKTSNRDWE
jgi:hypothetical protein